MTAFANRRFLYTLIFHVLPSAAFRIPGAIVRAGFKQLPLGPAVWNGFAGALMAKTPPDQLRAILPSTIDVYDAWVGSHGASRAVDILAADNSTRLLWLGPRKSNKVVLFFHGMMLCSSAPPRCRTTAKVERWWICDAAFQRTPGLDGIYQNGGRKGWDPAERVHSGIRFGSALRK